MELQGALGARDVAAAAGVDPDGGIEGAGHGLESRLDLVVVVYSGQHGEVEVDLRGKGEGLEEVVEEVGWQATDFAAEEAQVEHGVRPPAQVDRGAGKRFIEGHVGGAGADEPGLIAGSLGEGLAEADADVFDGVVVVDPEVAGAADFEVEHAVFGDVAEHVVEEADPGLGDELPGTIEVQLGINAGLGGAARNGANASGHVRVIAYRGDSVELGGAKLALELHA